MNKTWIDLKALTQKHLPETNSGLNTMKTKSGMKCLMLGCAFFLSSTVDAGAAVPLHKKTSSNAAIDMVPIGTYSSGIFDESAAEIPAYSPVNKRLYIVKANEAALDVLDLSNPERPRQIGSIDLSEYGTGVNSVAVKGNLIAVAVEKRADKKKNRHSRGKIVFMDLNGEFIKAITAGYLPDMVTFTPDGKTVLVANEGEPSVGATMDPPGTITLIDLSSGIRSASATELTFKAFDKKAFQLKQAGVRIFPFGQNKLRKPSVDLEPEYIAVSPDGRQAFVSLQENNALAVVDLKKKQIVDVIPMGVKDWSRGAPDMTLFPFRNLPDLPNQKPGAKPVIKQGGFSSLWFDGSSNDGRLHFLTTPDRGPNKPVKGSKPPRTIFPVPDYQHRIVKFSINPARASAGARLTGEILLTRKDGKTPITALPNIKGWSGEQIPVDINGNILSDKYDAFGGDMEGIVRDRYGAFWIVDEYRPAIYHFRGDGVLIERFVPKGTAALGGDPEGTYGKELLPEEYLKRKTNRGFEACAYDPGKNLVYAFIQSPMLNPTAAAVKGSSVIRILAMDVATSRLAAEYVMFLENPAHRIKAVDKIGDATFIGEDQMVIIERDATKTSIDGKKYIHRINVRYATNLLGKTARDFGGKQLEQLSADEFAALGLKPVHKIKITNLPSLGYYPSDKAEGIALLPDGSYGILNDNDFAYDYKKGSLLKTPIQFGILSFAPGNWIDVVKDKQYNPRNQPIFGLYQPDAIASFAIRGKTYYITANEGDDRDDWYDDTDFSDATKLKKKARLDNAAFPMGSEGYRLKRQTNLRMSSIDGDIDGDGDFEAIYGYGGRSFSILDAYGNMIFDSGDIMETVTAKLLPKNFNTSNDKSKIENRTEKKGPEPEGVTTGKIKGRTYAFITLERIGGIMVYDVSDPYNPAFVQYVNRRNFKVDAEKGTRNDTVGDLGPEGLVFIGSNDSPNGKPLLVVCNEVSGSTTIYQINRR